MFFRVDSPASAFNRIKTFAIGYLGVIVRCSVMASGIKVKKQNKQQSGKKKHNRRLTERAVDKSMTSRQRAILIGY